MFWKYLALIFMMLFIPCLSSSGLFGWDGYDYDAGEFVEVEKGNLVRKDEDIEVYHWDDGAYHDEEVQGFDGKELETYDYSTGEYNSYEMD